MLDPQTRHLYLSSLRPPPDYRLDCALATTFSLDLLTLLMAPLSLALATEQEREQVRQDPIAVLESLRRIAGRLVIFCQAGRIAVPQTNLLYSYLEPIVVEVQPERGVFHPKIWLLRFVAPQQPIYYRLLCLSRNLTFDRSWDTILTLEGILNEERKVGYGLNRPLVHFVGSLPELSLRSITPQTLAHVSLIAGEIGRVKFDSPSDFESIDSFLPTGISGHKRLSLPKDFSRLLVMSPFLSDRIIADLLQSGRDNVLISRSESLDQLKPATLRRLTTNTKIYVMTDTAERPDEPEPETETEAPVTIEDLSGLHAKLYVGEWGRQATIITGSANATNSAFNGNNVEFLIQLSGRKKKIGIEAFLGTNGQETPLQKMLQPYHHLPATTAVDQTAYDLEQRLETARANLLHSDLSLRVEPELTNSAGLYSLLLSPRHPGRLKTEVEILCTPITLDFNHARSLAAKVVQFPNLTLKSLTGFMAFELIATQGSKQKRLRFVLNLPIAGLPAERDKEILHSIISDRQKFIRYLLFILSDETDFDQLQKLISDPSTTNSQNGLGSGVGLPLLEELVRATSRAPEKIDRIAALVADLNQSEQGRAVLPEAFDHIWIAFETWRKGAG